MNFGARFRGGDNVAAIMPAYNSAQTIRLAIDSVLHQVGIDVSLIVCDDGSEDDTAKQVQDRQGSHRNVALLKNGQNLGPGYSRDRAIAHAECAWVAFIDADDVWHSSRMRRLVLAADATGADVAFDDMMLCHDGGSYLSPWRRVHGSRAFGGAGKSPRIIKSEDYIRAPRLLMQPVIRTEFIRNNGIRHSSRRFAEDAEFYLRLANAGARFCYVPEPLYLYRITPGSLTSQAKDHSLMRQCLEECKAWAGWSIAQQTAFVMKIASLQRNEAMYSIADNIYAGNTGAALKMLIKRPDLYLSLAMKITSGIHYQAHRIAHSGRRRT